MKVADAQSFPIARIKNVEKSERLWPRVKRDVSPIAWNHSFCATVTLYYSTVQLRYQFRWLLNGKNCVLNDIIVWKGKPFAVWKKYTIEIKKKQFYKEFYFSKNLWRALHVDKGNETVRVRQLAHTISELVDRFEKPGHIMKDRCVSKLSLFLFCFSTDKKISTVMF